MDPMGHSQTGLQVYGNSHMGDAGCAARLLLDLFFLRCKRALKRSNSLQDRVNRWPPAGQVPPATA